jgi:hypothetical protein
MIVSSFFRSTLPFVVPDGGAAFLEVDWPRLRETGLLAGGGDAGA